MGPFPGAKLVLGPAWGQVRLRIGRQGGEQPRAQTWWAPRAERGAGRGGLDATSKAGGGGGAGPEPTCESPADPQVWAFLRRRENSWVKDGDRFRLPRQPPSCLTPPLGGGRRASGGDLAARSAQRSSAPGPMAQISPNTGG